MCHHVCNSSLDFNPWAVVINEGQQFSKMKVIQPELPTTIRNHTCAQDLQVGVAHRKHVNSGLEVTIFYMRNTIPPQCRHMATTLSTDSLGGDLLHLLDGGPKDS